jgi:SWI/SNF-related matrix-associated actin-dependent regulator of chromatin subfamily A protein 2/4
LTYLWVQSELLRWLPSVSCIYYVGHKDQRAKTFAQVSFLIMFDLILL